MFFSPFSIFFKENEKRQEELFFLARFQTVYYLNAYSSVTFAVTETSPETITLPASIAFSL